MTTDLALTVAHTILSQMGGIGRLITFVGAHRFTGAANEVQFWFKGSRQYNVCRVILNEGLDLYTMQLCQYSPKHMTLTKKFELSDMYFDMLIPVFESQTGLCLHF